MHKRLLTLELNIASAEPIARADVDCELNAAAAEPIARADADCELNAARVQKLIFGDYTTFYTGELPGCEPNSAACLLHVNIGNVRVNGTDFKEVSSGEDGEGHHGCGADVCHQGV